MKWGLILEFVCAAEKDDIRSWLHSGVGTRLYAAGA
jgi:hypothetical protein